MTKTVGLIGLGAMGGGMAQSLRRAGHAPHVFDVRSDVAQAFARDGGVACATLAELGAASDVVISVVVNAAQTEAVLFGDGATPGCAASMKPGSSSHRWRGSSRFSSSPSRLSLSTCSTAGLLSFSK